jgi:hypothetical protein
MQDILCGTGGFGMNLEINKAELTIMGVRFDNNKDFRSVWHALSTNMFEGWKPNQKDVLHLRERVAVLRRELHNE